jgi:hypothetical protein
MPPLAAGQVLHVVTGPSGSRIPFIILLAIIFLGPIYFGPQYWWMGAGGFALFTAIYLGGSALSEARECLSSLCENGLLVTKRGAEELIPWKEVMTMNRWVHQLSHGYNVHARGRAFALGNNFNQPKLQEMVDTVVARAPLQWVHDVLAVRPENVAVAQATLDKIMAKIS